MMSQLKDYYFNPSNPGSYGGVEALYKSLRQHPTLSSLKKPELATFLRSVRSYTLHKPIRRKFTRRKVVVSGINAMWQADLMDMQSMKKENKGYRFVLVVIDVFSKRGYLKPLKDKRAISIVTAFKKILTESVDIPYKIQTDKGSEFINREMKSLGREKGFKIFTSEDDVTKAQIVERFIRTVKNKLYSVMEHNRSGRWMEHLDAVVKAYNNTVHSTTGYAPNQIDREVEETVFQKMYPIRPEYINKKPMTNLQVGDYVRLLNKARVFKKGFASQWTEEVFRIRLINRNLPVPIVKVKDLMDEDITGYFYTQEVQMVEKPIFVINKVMQYKKSMVHVSFKGYPSKFNKWITRRNLKLLRENK